MAFGKGLLAIFLLLGSGTSSLLVNHSFPPTERTLREDLFRTYDKLVRPVKNHRDTVPISISLSLLFIKELHEYAKELVLHTWVTMYWKDEYLQWNPEDYDGINSLNLPASEIWRPDMTLYTGISDEALMPRVLTQVIVFSNGTVIWVPPFTIRNFCTLEKDLNVTSNFRSLKTGSHCLLKIGSWTYSDKQINLEKLGKGIDLSNFRDTNPHWELVFATSKKETKKYPCCPETYSSINFDLLLKQRVFHDFVKADYLQNRLEEKSKE